MENLVEFVKAELTKIPGVRRTGKKYTFILCPWHNEKTPSGRVFHDELSLGTGSFKCYGCGKKASWNELADKIGLTPLNKSEIRKAAQRVPPANFLLADDEFLSSKKTVQEELKHFDIRVPNYQKYAGMINGKWRGFKAEFLHDLGASLVRKTFVEADYHKFYVFLPIHVKGKLRGYIKAQVHKPKSKDIPSYINSSGGWSLKYGLFPYDPAVELMDKKSLRTLVLVEGPRDALRLLKMGIPAVCIMGTHSWSAKKLKYLILSGAERIILMMDGDAAGKKATKLIRTGIDANGNQVTPPLKETFDVKVFKLWKEPQPEDGSKYDPGNCPTEMLLRLKEYLI